MFFNWIVDCWSSKKKEIHKKTNTEKNSTYHEPLSEEWIESIH